MTVKPTIPSARPTDAQTRRRAGLRRIGGQGVLLTAGFAAAQTCAFLRNAILGHWLSPSDFGIAAAITLMLQMVETLSDLGADRLLVQAPDGDRPRLQATAHATLVARGLLTSLALVLAAGPATYAFGIPEARWAFEAIAFVPAIKGFLHLDARRYQRHLKNRPQVLVEVLPQALALAATAPLLSVAPSYAAVVWLAFAQAAAAVAASHLVAERRYRLALDIADLRRLVAFGWPIWLSAFPLVAVYQGDRMIVGGFIGMEALASYTAAFLITMVPGLLAARVGHALMLPLLSAARARPRLFARRHATLLALTAVVAIAYFGAFATAGGALLPLAFGAHYAGQGAVLTALAAMWAVRMIQAVPGMALMAHGETRPFLWAGLIRAIGLPLAVLAIDNGWGLVGAAWSAAFAEALSLAYVMVRSARLAPLDARLFTAIGLIGIAAAAAASVASAATAGSPILQIAAAAALGFATLLAGAAVLAPLRRLTHMFRPSASPDQTRTAQAVSGAPA